MYTAAAPQNDGALGAPANNNAKAPAPATRPASTQANSGPKPAGAPATRPVQITTTDGKPAEVYEIDRGTRELRRLGQTPYNYEGRFGDKVKLVFRDYPIDQLLEAGVNLSSPEPVEAVLQHQVAQLFLDFGRQTGGPREVVSNSAVVDSNAQWIRLTWFRRERP